MTSNLKDLAERVAKLEGADRETDARIYLLLTDARNEFVADDGAGVRYRDFERQHRHVSWDRIKHFTRSIDEIAKVIDYTLGDWTYLIDATAPDLLIDCELFGPNNERLKASARTEALARCAALLQALQANQERQP